MSTPERPAQGTEPGRRRAERGRGRPVAVWIGVIALSVVAAALAWLAVDAALRLGSGQLTVGAQVFLLVLYLALAAWVGATAAGLFRGRSWTRGAATAILLFCVLLSTWMWTGGDVLLGVGLFLVAGAGIVSVMSAGVSRHLRRR